MTTITQNIDDIAGVDDNTSWTFYTQSIRESDDSTSIISTKKVRKYPLAGVLTVELDPGPAVVLAADGKTYPFTVPDTDSTLWPLIQAAVTIPPSTTHQQLLDAVDAWLLSHTDVWENIPDIPAPLLAGPNVANGYAGLDGTGKIGTAQLPISAMEYKGNWNVSTNSPTLADGTGSAGDVYKVSVAGSRNLGSGSITFDAGDYVIYNGTVWEKDDTTDAVSSVAGRTGAVTLTSADIALSTYDITGATDGASFLQSALTANPVVFLKPGSTLLLNSGVFLDSAAALGAGFTGTYIIDGQGTATIKLGSGLPTVPQFSRDTSRKWAIHLNTERTALSAGAVTHSDATRSTGGAYPEMPRLIIRNCVIDGNNLNAGLVFGNTAATKFVDCQFQRLMSALSWVGYADGNGLHGGQIYSAPTSGSSAGSWLIDQIANGDGVSISDFKGLWYGVWRAIDCNGGFIHNSIQGQFDLQNCNDIVFDGGHNEPADTPVTGVPTIKINNSNVTFRNMYSFAAADTSVPFIQIDETTSSGIEYSSHVVIEDPLDVHYYQSIHSDPAWSSYLHIKNINAASTVEIRHPLGESIVAGLDLHAGASFHVTSDDAGVTTALADGRFASKGGVLANRNGTWEIAPVMPGLTASRALVAPNFQQAFTGEAGAVGTLTAATYNYVMALLDDQGRYTNQSAVQTCTLASTGSVRMLANILTAPARLAVWRKSGSGVQTAPTAYAVLPVTNTQLRLYDTGTHIDGVSWITTSVPVPNTVAASNLTADTAITLAQLAAAAYASAQTASVLAQRDAQGNLNSNNFLSTPNSAAASGSTISLTIGNSRVIVITGTTTNQLIKLPTTSVPEGHSWTIVSQLTTGLITVQSSGSNTVAIIPGGTTVVFTSKQATPTTAAHWDADSPRSKVGSLGDDYLPAGFATMPRHNASNDIAASASGQLDLQYFTADKSAPVTTLRSVSMGTAAAATPTLVRFGIYSVAANGDLTLIGSTPSDTALFASIFTYYNKNLSVVTPLIWGQRYAYGLLVVSASARPSTAGCFIIDGDTSPRLAGVVTGQTDLPSTITAGSVASSSVARYITGF